MFLSESAVSAYPKLLLQQIGTIQMLSPSLRIICGDWARKLFLNIILFYLFFSTVFAGDFEIVQSSAAPVSVCPYGPSCRTGLLLCLTLPRGCSSLRTSFLQISSYFFPFYFFLPANFSKKPDQLHIHFPRRLQEQIKLSSFLLC